METSRICFQVYTVIINNKLIKKKGIFMDIGFNLYFALIVAFLALVCSIRLGISLFQSA